MVHSYLYTVPEGARQWKEFIAHYASHGSEREKKAVDALINYVKYERFSSTQKVKLISQGLQPCFKFHQNGSESYERLTSFSRLCVLYLFTDKEVFEAFQKELGRIQSKEEKEKRECEEREKKQENIHFINQSFSSSDQGKYKEAKNNVDEVIPEGKSQNRIKSFFGIGHKEVSLKSEMDSIKDMVLHLKSIGAEEAEFTVNKKIANTIGFTYPKGSVGIISESKFCVTMKFNISKAIPDGTH